MYWIVIRRHEHDDSSVRVGVSRDGHMTYVSKLEDTLKLADRDSALAAVRLAEAANLKRYEEMCEHYDVVKVDAKS